MRIASDIPNTLRLQDHFSDSRLELYFKTPTPKQHAAYTNGMTKRIKNKVINCTGECRQKFGKEILSGFRDGDFGEMQGEKVLPVSSFEGNPGYRKDWKDWFCLHNADLVEKLAIHAFENTAEEDDSEELPDGEGQEDEDGKKEETDPNGS